jgi:polyisoprenoid-binding protein YceI
MRQLLSRPIVRIGLGGAAVLVIALGAGAFYVFGGGSPAHAPLTVPTLVATKDGTIFTIDSSASEASFTIHEVLFGNPNTVVGKTNQVAGQILVDKSDVSKSQVGVIKVDLSTMQTDNNLRNRTLQGRIFETSDPSNQFATFTPKTLTGLPTTVVVGQTVSFTIVGDLALHGVTHTETFAAQVTAQSATVLTGQAQTTVRYEDFNLAIPNVPSVTGVSDNVTLAITFTARA